VVTQVTGPGAEELLVGLRRVGDHRRQDARVVVAAIPQLPRQCVIDLEPLAQHANVGVAYAVDLAANAVAPIGLTSLLVPQRFQLGQHFLHGRHIRPLLCVESS
jgi:hypothetical protein